MAENTAEQAKPVMAYMTACAIADEVCHKNTGRDGKVKMAQRDMLALAQVCASIAQTQATVLLMRVVQQSGSLRLGNDTLDQISNWETAVSVCPVIDLV